MDEPTTRELEIQIKNLCNKMDLKFSALEQARELQAAEYERRLTALNHAHEQMISKERSFVPRETYDVWHDVVTAFMANNQGRDKGISIAWAVVVVIVMVALAVISRFLK